MPIKVNLFTMIFKFYIFIVILLFFLFGVTHIESAPQFQVTPTVNCTLTINCVKLNVPSSLNCPFGELFNGTNCIILIRNVGAINRPDTNIGISGSVTPNVGASIYPVQPVQQPQPIPSMQPTSPSNVAESGVATPSPRCPNGYEWNGQVCHASRLDCPPNYRWNGVACFYDTSTDSIPSPPIITSGSVTQPLERPVIVFSRPPHIVTTEKPHSYPPTPKCYLDYEWNGKVCVKNVSMPPKCPIDYILAGNQCQHVIGGKCPSGYRLQNSQCVGDRIFSVDCPPNYKWNGESCVHVINACPLGYKLTADGRCEKTVTGSCPSGSYLQNNQCIQHNVAGVECLSGYRWNGNECVQFSPVCEPGYRLVNQRCEQILYAHPLPNQSCTDGFEYKDGECVSLDRKCPNGYRLNGNLCVEIAPSCPNGYEYNSHDSTCIQHRPPPVVTNTIAPSPICPSGYSLIGNRCTVNILTTTTHHPSPLPKCPADYTLNGSFCVFVGLYQPKEGQNVFIKPTCPDGYVFHIDECVESIVDSNRPAYMTPSCPPGYNYDSFNNKCYAINIDGRPHSVQPLCPEGFLLVHDQCLIRYNPPVGQPVTTSPVHHASEVCPVGYTWSNNICIPIQPICPEGFIFYKNACYLKPKPHTDVTNGEAQIQTSTENTYWEPSVSYVPSKCPSCDKNQNPTHITTIINYNNTVYSPINIVSNHSNDVRIYRGDSAADVVTSSSHSGGVLITRNNETTYQPLGENCTQTTIQIGQPDQEQSQQSNQPQHLTDSREFAEEEVPCCEIISPRQCKRVGSGEDTEWTCFHRKYQRCGPFCTQPKIYLKPRRTIYIEPILIIPPPLNQYNKGMTHRTNRLGGVGRFSPNFFFWQNFMKNLNFLNISDCSGCVNGGYRCSSDCFHYDCDQTNCDFLDEETFCNGESVKNGANEVCSNLLPSPTTTDAATTNGSSAVSANASKGTTISSTTTEASTVAESANA